jgi:uncharacterized membrane protein (UPF0127 family)
VNLEVLRARLDTASGREWVRRAVWTIAILSVLAFIVRGATRPEDPSFEASASADAATTAAGRVQIEGFGEVAFTTTDPAGMIAEWCALLADTDELRQRGLMGQDDLNGYDAMVFRFTEPSTGGFWMKDTIIPLTVAYFDADGRFVSSADMQPCPPGADCPSYPPEGEYVTAVEVPLGGLGAIGIGPGSVLGFGGTGCAAA